MPPAGVLQKSQHLVYLHRVTQISPILLRFVLTQMQLESRLIRNSHLPNTGANRVVIWFASENGRVIDMSGKRRRANPKARSRVSSWSHLRDIYSNMRSASALENSLKSASILVFIGFAKFSVPTAIQKLASSIALHPALNTSGKLGRLLCTETNYSMPATSSHLSNTSSPYTHFRWYADTLLFKFYRTSFPNL